MQCPKCSTENRGGRRFCSRCGAALELKCAACGFANDPGDEFCGGCGAALKEASPRAAEPEPQPDASPEPGPEVSEAERRQLTVMFCDLVASTALSSRLDPEDLREVIRAYQETCAAVIARYEGHIAKYIGDGLLVYFGYPQAHEDDARRAVHVGIGIVDGVAALSRRLGTERGVDLGVRIGIHTGLVVAGEMGGGETREAHAVVGETPNIAARLQELAEPNTIAISASTRRLIEGLFVCDDLGRQALKGVSESVPVFRVRGEAEASSRFDAAAEHGLTPLVGRGEEIGLLSKRWEQAKDGEGQVVLLIGEAGVGKSRIIRGFRARIEDEPHSRILYYCSPYHQNSALHPASDQLQRGLRLAKDDGPEQKLGKLQSVLEDLGLPVTDLAPVLASLLSLPTSGRYPALELGPEQLRRKTLDASIAMFEAMAAQQPVLMVVEDAQWIDPSTVELLNLTIERLRSVRVLLLIAFRPEFASPWGNYTHITALTLNRMSRKESAAIIAGVTGGMALPAEVLEQILDKTDGVPLFVEELTKTVLESELLRGESDGYVLTGPLPPLAIPASLQDSLMARLDRLTPVKELAQLAATIGRSFTHTLLAEVSSLDEAELEAALSRLAQAGLIYRRGTPPDASYEFEQALVRDTAYQSLLKSNRQHYHQRIAQALERRFPDTVETEPEVVAWHYTEAGLAEPAVGYWQRAGKRAAERSANAEAVAHLSKGLELVRTLADTPERARTELAMQISLGPALMTTRGIVAPEVDQAYARARELAWTVGDTTERFAALWGHYYVFEIRAQWRDALDNTEEVLRLAHGQNDPGLLLQAHHAAWTANLYSGDLLAAREHTEQGRDLYSPQEHHLHKFVYGAHDPGACARFTQAMVLSLLGYADQASWCIEDAMALARELAHPATLAFTAFCTGCAYQFLGDVDGARRLAEISVAVGTEHGVTPAVKMATLLRAWTLARSGQTDEGLTILRRILDPVRAKKRRGFMIPYYHGLRADVCATQGLQEEGLEVLEEALDAASDQGERFWEAELHRLRGDLLLARSQGDGAAAETSYQQALEIARSQSAKSLELRAATSLARLWGEDGRRSEAGDLLAPVYDWFTEGFDTHDLTEAKALLDQLA